MFIQGFSLMKIFQLPSQAELSNEVMINASNWSQVHNGFHDELTSIYQWIQGNLSASSLYRNKEGIDKITACIYKYTGIKVVVNSSSKYFAMIPPDLNKNHVLISLTERRYFKNHEVRSRVSELRGSVDIKNFKVSGEFSNIPVTLYLDPYLIFSGVLSSRNLSAATLHEIGHAFSYFALVADIVSTNLPMVALINNITNTEQDDEIEYILKEWNGNDEVLTKVDVTELEGKKKETIVTALLTNHIRDTVSAAKTKDYDLVNTEYVADNFASRLGAGADMVSALDKIYALYGHRNRGGLTSFLFNELWTGASFIIGVAYNSVVAVLEGNLLMPFILFYKGILAVISETTNTTDGTYDTTVRRFQRVREDMVVMLKNKEIDKAIGNRIRDDIKRVEEILKSYNNYKSALGRVFDFVLPKHRRRVTQAEFYKELEQLSANNLFLASYDLRSLQ